MMLRSYVEKFIYIAIGTIIVSLIIIGVSIISVPSETKDEFYEISIEGLKEKYSINEHVIISPILSGYGGLCGEFDAYVVKDDKPVKTLSSAVFDCLGHTKVDFSYDISNYGRFAEFIPDESGSYLLKVAFHPSFGNVATVYSEKTFIVEPQESVSQTSSSQAQITHLSFVQLVRFSDIILIGTVVDNELEVEQIVEKPNPINLGEGVDLKSLEHTDTYEYQSVTLDVEEYLKDVTGNYSDPYIFRDFWSAKNKHQIGDRAIFLIDDSMWGWVSIESLGHKFPIDQNNKVQIPLFHSNREFGMPDELELAKNKIKQTLIAVSEVLEFLESEDSKEKITIIMQKLNEKGIPFKEKSVTRSIDSRLIEKRIAGEIIVLDVQTMVQEIESGVTMSEGDKKAMAEKFNSDVEITLASNTKVKTEQWDFSPLLPAIKDFSIPKDQYLKYCTEECGCGYLSTPDRIITNDEEWKIAEGKVSLTHCVLYVPHS